MTEAAAPVSIPAAGIAQQADSGGALWHLELDRSVLLPGRLVGGRIRVTAKRDVDARGVVVALIGGEHWRHRETSTDANGNSDTEVVTTRQELTREPVQIAGEIRLGAGETRDWSFELPVPPMGPASLDAEDAGL